MQSGTVYITYLKLFINDTCTEYFIWLNRNEFGGLVVLLLHLIQILLDLN